MYSTDQILADIEYGLIDYMNKKKDMTDKGKVQFLEEYMMDLFNKSKEVANEK